MDLKGHLKHLSVDSWRRKNKDNCAVDFKEITLTLTLINPSFTEELQNGCVHFDNLFMTSKKNPRYSTWLFLFIKKKRFSIPCCDIGSEIFFGFFATQEENSLICETLFKLNTNNKLEKHIVATQKLHILDFRCGYPWSTSIQC